MLEKKSNDIGMIILCGQVNRLLSLFVRRVGISTQSHKQSAHLKLSSFRRKVQRCLLFLLAEVNSFYSAKISGCQEYLNLKCLPKLKHRQKHRVPESGRCIVSSSLSCLPSGGQ